MTPPLAVDLNEIFNADPFGGRSALTGSGVAVATISDSEGFSTPRRLSPIKGWRREEDSEDVVFCESVLLVFDIFALVIRLGGDLFLNLITGLVAGTGGRGLAGNSGESDSPYATARRDRVDLVEVVGTGEMDLVVLPSLLP